VQFDVREYFRELAVNGHLSAEADEWAKATFESRSVIRPVFEAKAGRVEITYRPAFKSFDGKVAYVLLRVTGTDVRFGVCNKCQELWFDLREGGGRKRENFCSSRCRKAFNQSKYEANKAAKHK
jgi:hypothetical protein